MREGERKEKEEKGGQTSKESEGARAEYVGGGEGWETKKSYGGDQGNRSART